jgi:geranylgeranyl pyrophosphate synthase
VRLKEIYEPIAGELVEVEGVISTSIRAAGDETILELGDYLLSSPGKRTRPALVILCERAARGEVGSENGRALIETAAAVELVHMSSLIHDDVLDGALMRHGKASMNAKWGEEVSIAFGDYVYAKAFELVGRSGSKDVFACLSEAICLMCEGELGHVCRRGSFDMERRDYIDMLEKKTASFFGACCQLGVIVGGHRAEVRRVLGEFGFNLGMAFQIVDDCKDLMGEEELLGKKAGQDVLAGDVTLPVLFVFESASESERAELKRLLKSGANGEGFRRIRELALGSEALSKSKEMAGRYLGLAKERLGVLAESAYKVSLVRLADYITEMRF